MSHTSDIVITAKILDEGSEIEATRRLLGVKLAEERDVGLGQSIQRSPARHDLVTK